MSISRSEIERIAKEFFDLGITLTPKNVQIDEAARLRYQALRKPPDTRPSRTGDLTAEEGAVLAAIELLQAHGFDIVAPRLIAV